MLSTSVHCCCEVEEEVKTQRLERTHLKISDCFHHLFF